MGIVIWVVAFLLLTICSLAYRLAFAVKRQEKIKQVIINECLIYAVLFACLVVATCLAIKFKTTLSYMYLCSSSVVLIFNFLMSAFIWYIYKKEI